MPSLALYRQPDPVRTPSRREFRDWIDVVEYAIMAAGGFPEPLTFSLRAARLMRRRARGFDVIHDNQTLGYGLLSIQRLGRPLVTTIHHPIAVDRRIDLAAAKQRGQAAVAAPVVRLRAHAGRGRPETAPRHHRVAQLGADIVRDFRVPPERLRVIPVGVDPTVFHPMARHVVAMPADDVVSSVGAAG